MDLDLDHHYRLVQHLDHPAHTSSVSASSAPVFASASASASASVLVSVPVPVPLLGLLPLTTRPPSVSTLLHPPRRQLAVSSLNAINQPSSGSSRPADSKPFLPAPPSCPAPLSVFLPSLHRPAHSDRHLPSTCSWSTCTSQQSASAHSEDPSLRLSTATNEGATLPSLQQQRKSTAIRPENNCCSEPTSADDIVEGATSTSGWNLSRASSGRSRQVDTSSCPQPSCPAKSSHATSTALHAYTLPPPPPPLPSRPTTPSSSSPSLSMSHPSPSAGHPRQPSSGPSHHAALPPHHHHHHQQQQQQQQPVSYPPPAPHHYAPHGSPAPHQQPHYSYPPQPVDHYRQSPTGPPPHSLALPSMRSFDQQQQQQPGQPPHPQHHPHPQHSPYQVQHHPGQHHPYQPQLHMQPNGPMGSTMAPGPHVGYFSIQPQPYGMHDPMAMRYGLPPGLYDPRMQLSGGRHKKVRGVVLRAFFLSDLVRRCAGRTESKQK